MTDNKLIFWACDYSDKTGEGNLARKFIKENFKKKKIKIKTLKLNNFLHHKYISPLVGIISCWKYYLKGYNVGYINFLPLWNFLIFFLLPPKTILGPITGGSLYNKSDKINYIIRHFLFSIFYKFSEIALNLRFKNKLVFSTELLKTFLSNKTVKRSKFNFVLENLKFNKKKKIKDIDILIYYREHYNKNLLFNFKLVKNLSNHKLNIFVVGDKLNIKKVTNLGYINKKRLNNLQSRSKYSLSSGENIYSLFTIECITNHVKILIDKKNMKKIKVFKKFFITYNKSNLIFKKNKNLK